MVWLNMKRPRNFCLEAFGLCLKQLASKTVFTPVCGHTQHLRIPSPTSLLSPSPCLATVLQGGACQKLVSAASGSCFPAPAASCASPLRKLLSFSPRSRSGKTKSTFCSENFIFTPPCFHIHTHPYIQNRGEVLGQRKNLHCKWMSKHA